MFPSSGFAGRITNTNTGGTVSVPTGTTNEGIQKWIRGSGLFRRMCNVSRTTDMTDAHWQGFVIVPYDFTLTAGTTTTLKVHKPTSALSSLMDPFTPVSGFDWNGSDAPPVGAWTVVFNPNNTNPVVVSFGDQFELIWGTNEAGQQISENSPYSISLSPQRMLLLFYIGTSRYFIRFL